MAARAASPQSPVRAVAGVQALAAHRMLVRFALALGSVFVWIAIYRYFYRLEPGTGEAFARTAFLFALVQAVTLLAAPLVATRVGQGLTRGMIAGIVAAAAGFALLAVFGAQPSEAFPTACIAFALLFGIFRASYRAPYATAHATALSTAAAGFAEVLVISAPLCAGLVLEAGLAMTGILAAAAALLLLSLVPLLLVPPAYERYRWGYREAFVHLLAREHRPLFLYYLYRGIEGTALLLAWPIMIFVISGRSFAVTGTVLSLALLAALLIRLAARRMTLAGRQASQPFLMTLAGSSWIMRLVAATPFDIFLVDTYAHVIPTSRGVLDRASFEQAADDSTYIDEYSVLKDQALTLGRLLSALGVGVLALHGELSFAFVALFLAAAIAAILAVPLSLRRGRVTF